VCPKDNDYLFYSPGSQTAWLIGEWLCYEPPTPVELASFSGSSNNGNVNLTWTTTTEMNNKGFEVEKFVGDWQMIGYVPGFGTTTEPKLYSFTDINVTSEKHSYRLKQVDYDGTFEYSDVIEVEVDFVPAEYLLHQNYPNPFNPSTVIEFSLPEDVANVKLSIYNALGEKVAELVNTLLPAGRYSYTWNAQDVVTGIYICELRTEEFVSVKKMVLMK
jgi:hypothetical protein